MVACMQGQRPKLDYASLSDVGRRRLANEDAYHCDEAMSLFTVCDGIGGQPSGEAASQIIAPTFKHLVRRQLRTAGEVDPPIMQSIMVQAAQTLAQQLYEQAQPIAVLKEMGATIVTAMIRRNTVVVMNAGDSRAYLLREGQMEQLSTDHNQRTRAAADEGDLTDRQLEEREARRLTQFIGVKADVQPQTRTVELQQGDRLLLCTDGLTDPVPLAKLQAILGHGLTPRQTCKILIDAANLAGGPDNITAVVVDYKGLDRGAGPAAGRNDKLQPARGVASAFYAHLQRIEQDLLWLLEGAKECAALKGLSALAAVKRRLGADVFTSFLRMHPMQNPMHVFHRACTMPNSGWREQYAQHMAELEPSFGQLTSGCVRLSAILTSEETATILKALWGDWRRVEEQYFGHCQRDAMHEAERTATALIEHMLCSARTLRGLLEFFPRFMRPKDQLPAPA